MAKHLGRELLKSEVVHHKNGNVQDDRLSNLELLKDQSEHVTRHNLARTRVVKDLAPKRVKIELDPELAPLCACGCGKQVTIDCYRNRYNKFVVGHWLRSMSNIAKPG